MVEKRKIWFKNERQHFFSSQPTQSAEPGREKFFVGPKKAGIADLRSGPFSRSDLRPNLLFSLKTNFGGFKKKDQAFVIRRKNPHMIYG